MSLFFVILGTGAGTLIPYTFKKIIDGVGSSGQAGAPSVWVWATVYVVLSFVGSMAWRGSGLSGLRWATGVRKLGRDVLNKHVLGHSHNFFSNKFAGALSTKISQASEGVRSLAESILWKWSDFILELAISLYLIFSTDLYIGLVFVLWIIVVAPINVYLFRKKVPFGKAAARAEADLNAHTVDVLSNIAAARDYARGHFEFNFLTRLTEKRRIAGAYNWILSERARLVNDVLESLFAGLIMFTALYLWSLSRVTAGDLVLIVSLIAIIRSSLKSLGDHVNGFADTLSNIQEALTDVFDEHEIKDLPNAKQLEISEAVVTFKDVSFYYGKRQIFKELNLHIKPGQRVGLVGKSGAGKSTLMKLLTRQHEISGGEIVIDGQNISHVTQDSLREVIAVVPQDPMLFHRSLRENIAYGKINATDKEIAEAARHAQAAQFIEPLVKKYETLVGERGIKLSGGERQRVAIARAFLKNAPILLLDEATSSLDSQSESMIQLALEDLMQGKTVIAIAHRLSTLRAMDRIVVLDGGQIVEDGTHEELLKKEGIYAELWAHQAGGFIPEE